MNYILNIDPILALLVCLLAGFSFWAGVEFCTARHKQRGIGVDPWEYLVPNDPSDLTDGTLPTPPREDILN